MKLSRENRYRVAIAAGCHERTVVRWQAGESVSPLARRAIERALAELGIDPPQPVEAAP